MDKFVFYSSIDHCGFVPKEKRAEYLYQEEVKPISLVVLECSEEYTRMLVDLLMTYPDTFEDMVMEELDSDLSIYQS